MKVKRPCTKVKSPCKKAIAVIEKKLVCEGTCCESEKPVYEGNCCKRENPLYESNCYERENPLYESNCCEREKLVYESNAVKEKSSCKLKFNRWALMSCQLLCIWSMVKAEELLPLLAVTAKGGERSRKHSMTCSGSRSS